MENPQNLAGNNPLSGPPHGKVTILLSRHRTTLAFQRTRLSADRTLMSIIRTSLSLIAFGFTIFQFFRSLKEIEGAKIDTDLATGQVGLAMVALGIGMLFLGILYHSFFMLQVRKERQRLDEEGLIAKRDSFPVSMTLITALLLLLLGIYIIFKMIVNN